VAVQEPKHHSAVVISIPVPNRARLEIIGCCIFSLL
jgi:hypothetical protein